MLPADARLYAILDTGYIALDEALLVARELVSAGIGILQLRAKSLPVKEVKTLGLQILPVCRDAGVPLIINDHVSVCVEIGADGVHVGQEDLSPSEVRKLIGPKCILGLSTHSVEQAEKGTKEPVDYLGFGPLFATPTKPDYVPVGLGHVREVHQNATVPIFCIGGIKRENLSEVLSQGARRVVIVSGILQSSDRRTYISECLRKLEESENQ